VAEEAVQMEVVQVLQVVEQEQVEVVVKQRVQEQLTEAVVAVELKWLPVAVIQQVEMVVQVL
tara:strand:+ start:324 stop:509 length:186 start_codon:yes stop_codon:yes gene_type:complete